MKKLSIFIFSLMVASFAATAQEQPPKFADWDPKPKMHPIPVEYFKEHAVVILESEKRDYIFEGKGTTMYSTIHRIVKVLDRKGIEQFNTITVPYERNQSRIDSIKARVILPDGTTRDVRYNMLYAGSGGIFFAFDGMEKNAEIELVVKYKALSSNFGSIYFQYTIPVLNTFFELNYPKEMTFNTKGYHGFPSGHEEIVGNHKQIKIYQADIPALERQPYSFYDLYTMRLEYGIDHYVSRGGYQRGEEYTYDKLAQNLYTRFYDKNMVDRMLPNRKNIRMDQVGLKESERLAVNRFLTNTVGIRGTESDEKKIKMIEDGIKTNIMQYWELSSREGDNLDTVLAKKSATDAGIVRLFAMCFRVCGINHELGKVSDRREHLMDKQFINWAPLDDYIFYFPDFDAYLAPTEQYYRYPELPYTMINNKGIFTKTNPEQGYVVGGDVAAADAIQRTIVPHETHATTFKMNTEISISPEMNTSADVTCIYTGYNAADLRLELAKTPKEKIKELIKDEVKIAERQEDLIRYSTSNESFSTVYENKPLIINAIVRVPDMIEKAGNRYIINAGNAIGSQPHLYDQKDRVLPVDLEYAFSNSYTINVNIPEGYKVVDVENMTLNVEQTDRDNGNTIAYFRSNWNLKGNKMVITIDESYPKTHYSVRDYGEFRKIMNAGADFNRGIIVLEKLPVKRKPMKAKKTVTFAKPVPTVNTVTVANTTTKTTTKPTVTKTVTKTTTVTTIKPAAAKPATVVTKPEPPKPAAKPTTPPQNGGQILHREGEEQQNRPVSLPPAKTTKPTPTKRANKA